MAAALACAENEDHAPLGTGGGGPIDNQSGTDSDADGDSDGDGDGDTDSDTDSDTDPVACTDQEVEGPAGLRCWRRCPEGEVWEDGFCTGAAIVHDFTGAVGACAMLGGGFHAATRAELTDLLGNCEDAVIDDGAEGSCDSCAASDQCFALFGVDVLTYWSSTEGDLAPWAVAFDSGAVFMAASAEEPYFVRCVRPL